MNRKAITQEQFDNALTAILEKLTGEQLLAQVPGIYSDVAEHFNNEVLEAIAEGAEAQEEESA